MVPVGACLALSAVLFGIGLIGFLGRRNIILMLVSVEIMLNAVNVSLAAFSHQLQDRAARSWPSSSSPWRQPRRQSAWGW